MLITQALFVRMVPVCGFAMLVTIDAVIDVLKIMMC